MGIYSEKALPRWVGVLILVVAFVVLYQPWQLGIRELTRQEGLYAVVSSELNPTIPIATAHGVAVSKVFPLFPAMASLFRLLTDMPMELSLRLVSVMMLGLSAVIVYFAATSERSQRAGMVATAMYIGSFWVIEKGSDGYPATMSAFFLLSAQLLFFQYGIRKTNWDLAWIFAALLLVAGFYTGGGSIILYFVFPMFFFRRPLSVRSKFRKPGFPIGVVLLSIAVLVWVAQFGVMPYQLQLWNFGLVYPTFWSYFRELLLFPLLLVIRLLPWALIAWMPFCVALQSLDTTPIFSRYLRTLVFSSLALLWLIPQGDTRAFFYFMGPLSILVGFYYDIGMRRYGIRIRRMLVVCEYIAVAFALAGIYFVLEPRLKEFTIQNWLSFRPISESFLQVLIAVVLLIVLVFFLHWGCRSMPIWLILLVTVTSAGIFYGSGVYPHRLRDGMKREFGATIKQALAGQPYGTLYKSNILDLYGELYYSGYKVVKLPTLEELPEDQETVYLINTEFPQYPERNWSNLLPTGYSYRGHRLYLWRGDRCERKTQPMPLL